MPFRRIGCNWKFAVEINLTKDAYGVIFSQGSRFGGCSMYIKGGKLKFVYNYIGLEEQMIVAEAALPTVDCGLGVSYDNKSISAVPHLSYASRFPAPLPALAKAP